MQKPHFVENQIYHIYNRGVEKRNIFLDDKDYLRFIHDLFEFNDKNSVFNIAYYFNSKSKEIESKHLEKERSPRKLLVEILIFTLMPNHFHLVLKQKRENGIVKFMQKLGTGYTNYFNKKYKRVGSLFQGRFKAALISEEAHFIHLPFYVHTNPIDLIYGSSTSIEAIEESIETSIDSIDWRKKVKFLENYKWSSFLDYVGKKNFPSVTQREFLLEFFGSQKEYQKETEKWLRERDENTDKIKEITLE